MSQRGTGRRHKVTLSDKLRVEGSGNQRSLELGLPCLAKHEVLGAVQRVRETDFGY